MDIVDLADFPEWTETLVGWALREWPARSPGDNAEARRKRLVGASGSQRDVLPFCLVLAKDGVPLGFVSVIHYILGGQETWQHWVDALYVLPEHRQHGWGGKLLREAERRARLLGVETLYAFTSAAKWYHAQGWKYTDQTSAEMAVLMKVL